MKLKPIKPDRLLRVPSISDIRHVVPCWWEIHDRLVVRDIILNLKYEMLAKS